MSTDYKEQSEPIKFLTRAVVKRIKPGRHRIIVRDAVEPSLAVVVDPDGARRWAVLPTDAGGAAPSILGACSRMSTGHARALARQHSNKQQLAAEPDTDRLQHRTLAQFAEEFVRCHLPTLAKTTQAGYRKALARILAEFGDWELCEIERKHVAAWLHEIAATSPGTADTNKGIFRTMMYQAIHWGWLHPGHPNPATRIKRHKQKFRADPFTTAELQRIGRAIEGLRQVDDECADIVLFIAYTGCRSGEARSLTWDEVKSDHVALNNSKTGPGALVVNTAAQSTLRRRREAALPGERYVFPNRHPRAKRGKIGTPRLSRFWSRIREKAGLAKHRRLYELRHTFASQGVMTGHTDIEVSGLLRHGKMASSDRYIFLSDEHTRQAANSVAAEIDQLLGERLPWKPTIKGARWLRYSLKIWGDRKGTQGRRW